jgi:hypothetical protein
VAVFPTSNIRFILLDSGTKVRKEIQTIKIKYQSIDKKSKQKKKSD